MIPLIFFGAMIVLFWVLIVMPQRRRRQVQQQLLSSLEPGDEVMTIGGLFGTVREVGDNHVVLEIAPDTQVRLAKSAVTARSEHTLEPAKDAGDAATLGRARFERTTLLSDPDGPHSCGPDRRCRARGSRLAAPEVTDARPRPPGRPRSRQGSGPEKGQTVDEEGLDDAVTIINDRINSTGVAEPEIRKQGDNQIVIELPGVDDQERAADLIGQTAKLELYDLQGDLVPGASLNTQGDVLPRDSLFDLLVSQQTAAKEGEPSSYYLVKGTKKGNRTEYKLVVGPKSTRQAVLASPYVKKNRPEKGELPKGTKLLLVPENMVVTTCGQAQRYCPGLAEAPDRTQYYLFRYDPEDELGNGPIPEMSGDDLERKGTRQDFDSGAGRTNEPVVTMQFTDRGADRFEEITRRLVERGRAKANRLGITDKNRTTWRTSSSRSCSTA